MTILTKRNALRSTLAGGALLVSASGAFAACTADVQSATLNGNTMTVTYEMDVSVGGYDHTRTSTFQGASSADLAAVQARIGGRSEGSGRDTTSRPTQIRVDAACDQAERGADRTIQRIINRTEDPVVRQPVVQQPVITKPDTPVVRQPVTQTTQVCRAEREVIQIGVPCNCENAEEYVKEVLPEVHDHFRAQGWEVIYYVDQNWQTDLAQVNVGAIHINPHTNAVQYGPVTRGIQLMQSDARLEHEGNAFQEIVAAANRSVQQLGQAQRICRTMQVRR